MEVKSKPIQITILDFMAILLPGLVWVLLLFVTIQLITTGQSSIINSPLTALSEASLSKTSEFSWTPIVLSVLAIALIIGYILKPIAMEISEKLTAILFKLKKKYSSATFKELEFPFTRFFENDCYKRIFIIVEKELGCKLAELPGKQPFSTLKRYIRLLSPPLWEECERMEAECRMLGALFLASVYSFLLCIVVLIFKIFGYFLDLSIKNNLVWLIVSIFVMYILAEVFNKLRFREVGFVYLNTLLVNKYKPSTTAKESDSDEE